ncbi:DMT family transporter [uncultured Ruegeria sp.]|uniref:DMT family transporter n=1 Tax=uncultured Ruegeria sp. TaxID=259304 RepID=UPI00262A8421|nr:DMT family transporter [uncultured Ruegeria sp.]
MSMPNRSAGVVLGILGMLGFSGTLVATRVAVVDFTPLDITCARIVMAGGLGAAFLILTGQCEPPERRFLVPILVMGLGLAIGYPFFLAMALESVPAVHSAVVTGLAPAVTAIIAVLRTGERPPPVFWIACLTGFCAVLYFAYDAGGGHLTLPDGWLFLGVLSLGIAYVEGGRVSRELSGSVTLSWSMLFLTPFAILPLLPRISQIDTSTISAASWVSLAYLGVVSMFLASVLWYGGLALGGIARIGQINLLLPLTALGWSALFLGEQITLTAIVCAVIVLATMVICLKTRS